MAEFKISVSGNQFGKYSCTVEYFNQFQMLFVLTTFNSTKIIPMMLIALSI
jgi:hypothetical protein